MPVGQNPFGNIIQHPGNDMSASAMPASIAADYGQQPASTAPEQPQTDYTAAGIDPTVSPVKGTA